VRRASSHIEWATPAVRLYKCWEKSHPRRGDFFVWTARQNTHWTRFELISNVAASEIRLQSNKPLDNCRLVSKRREGRGLWGRGRGFDMGSITVPDRSLQRQKKPSVTLVFCKLRPSFSLSRQRPAASNPVTSRPWASMACSVAQPTPFWNSAAHQFRSPISADCKIRCGRLFGTILRGVWRSARNRSVGLAGA